MTKVMLVEDDNNLREIYEARLQAEGYDIVAAKDGEEALVLAKANHPDLIISDVMMPKISGFEMLDILRNTDGLKDVKVIMLTALGQSDDQQRADKLGADRYLVKSQVTLEDIVKVAHELIDGPAAPEAVAAAAAVPAPGTTPAATPAPVATTIPVAEPTPTIDLATPPETPAAEPAVTTPVASEPAATPAPASEPAAATPAASGNSAQSTAQEEASVEANIEDFVAGATSDATTPTDSVPVVPTEPVTPVPVEEPAAAPPEPATELTVAPEAESTPAENAATDDKLITDAVDTLVASTEPKATDDAKPVVVTSDTSVEPEATPAVTVVPTTPAATEPDKPSDKADESPSNIQISGKKTITPIDSAPKHDLEALLAIENAKETGSVTTPTAPEPTISVATSATSKPSFGEAPAGSPKPDDKDEPVDPISVAL